MGGMDAMDGCDGWMVVGSRGRLLSFSFAAVLLFFLGGGVCEKRERYWRI